MIDDPPHPRFYSPEARKALLFRNALAAQAFFILLRVQGTMPSNDVVVRESLSINKQQDACSGEWIQKLPEDLKRRTFRG